jgi:electron transfer flavoprotein-quinone oxidoreductase
MLPKLVGDGVLVVGDAAGMCLNLGFTVRGMDLAIEAANIAAQTIIAAKESNDFSVARLEKYPRRWRKAVSCRTCGIIASCLA